MYLLTNHHSSDYHQTSYTKVSVATVGRWKMEQYDAVWNHKHLLYFNRLFVLGFELVDVFKLAFQNFWRMILIHKEHQMIQV